MDSSTMRRETHFSNYLLTHLSAAAEAIAEPGSHPFGLLDDDNNGLSRLSAFNELIPFVVDTRLQRGRFSYSSKSKPFSS
jgi:hypothetical protein